MQNSFTEFTKLLSSVQDENKVIYLKNGQLHIAQGSICLYRQLGGIIDVIWDSIKGNILLQSSLQTKTTYSKHQGHEIIKGVQFRDAHHCPYHEPQFTKSQKFYKPCACVLLVRKEDEHILITRRNLTLNSFPGAWVLPGGHLQKNQGLLEGGLRQVQEQVGLNINTAQLLLNHGVMAWQSAYHVNNKIVSCSFVIFFSAKVPGYEVKPQQTEIQEFKWKDAKYFEDQHKYTNFKKDGYGEAHLNYLSFYRKKNFLMEETKPWIQEEIKIKEKEKEKEMTNHIKL